MGIETALFAGLTVASTAMKAFGSVQQGDAALAQGQAQQQADNFNATAKTQQAGQAQAAADTEAQDYTRNNMRTVSAGRAALGASGVTAEGSPLMVDADTVRQVALGASRLRYGGAVQANRLNTESQLLTMKGNNDLRAGYAGQQAGYINAGTSILSGGASLFSGGRTGLPSAWGTPGTGS